MKPKDEGIIQISHLVKRFGEDLILDDLNLTVQKGESIVLIGPSGAGKSTALRCINGLERFESGSITVDGLPIPPGSRPDRAFSHLIHQIRLKVGMVFQSFNLFPHLTVMENLTLAPLRVLKADAREARVEATRLLGRVNLGGKEDAYPPSLSGGEQQRVAIARALAMRPQVILFDEPTSSLDPELVTEVLSVIADLGSDGYTMLIVTHQMDFARRSASRVVFLDQGKVVEQGPPERILENPSSERLRSFLSKCG